MKAAGHVRCRQTPLPSLTMILKPPGIRAVGVHTSIVVALQKHGIERADVPRSVVKDVPKIGSLSGEPGQ